ncbi:MAG: transcriptional regulator [Patescibacteria group bacterium]|nr:transcriptional regulator [Patescibacteria group bacterium]
MKRTDRRSDCAINFSLEMFGDPWSLLIVRDIVYFGKKTYGEFLASEERIGTSVLASRLAALEQKGILSKHPSQTDKRKDEYRLTEKGLDLVPVLLDLAEWGAAHDPETGASPDWIAAVRTNREAVTKRTRTVVREGGSVVGNYETVVQ